MPSDSSIAHERRYRELRRRAAAFSLLGLLSCVVLLSLVGPVHFEATSDALGPVQADGAQFALQHAPALICVGAIAGLFAGMLGMGGGVIKVAGLLVVFHLDMLLARAVSLTTMFVATSSAARVHSKNKFVLDRVVLAMLLPALAGVLAGVLLGTLLPRQLLTHLFGFFAVFMGLSTLAHSFGDPDEHVLRGDGSKWGAPGSTVHRAIGGVHGLLCGLVGISGGVIAVPMQQTYARVRAVNAVANTVVVSAWATGFGSVLAVASGVSGGAFSVLDVLFASVCIGLGGAVGAQLGARLTGKVSAFVLRLLFVQICLLAGLSILLG